MPEKFNSKNLSYASKPPPFLAALQAQAAGHGGPDPITAGRRRPGKKRSGSEEAEDAPLVVDEHGNTVALTVDKDGVVAAGQHDGPTEGEGEGEGDDAKQKETDKVTTKKDADVNAKMSIGGRKRKAVKIVGGGDEEVEAAGKDGTGATSVKGEKGQKNDKMGAKKIKKKGKAIKLSFDED
ncbi:hypothetical protein V2A60_002572 [Cordyceps javanica]|uniref:DUF4604 domain-containing protein n=1 Tax=Cordyceps javanica TaxID=43265 RepID=A0A545VX55_9HYPO|nr:hypothetical protein IF1G_07276 [Cordyceps javanica]TQW06266.1 hypothetical protein IF2G_06549 [Cordyceps javanica]